MEHVPIATREQLLLEDPTVNAGELYDLYSDILRDILAGADQTGDYQIPRVIDIINRQKVVSKFLPANDVRSYAYYKANNNQR